MWSVEASRLGASRDREAGEAPLADAIVEAPDAVAVAAQESDPAGAPTVGAISKAGHLSCVHPRLFRRRVILL